MNVRELTDEERQTMREKMYPKAREAYLAQAGDAGKTIVDAYEAEYQKLTDEK
jgi:C4-dicarboxylate-binding protein DctP